MTVTAGQYVLFYCFPSLDGETTHGFFERRRAAFKSRKPKQTPVDFLGADEGV
jgi:hypothetical protein